MAIFLFIGGIGTAQAQKQKRLGRLSPDEMLECMKRTPHFAIMQTALPLLYITNG
ncbi:MAG: hypothetical protein ACTTJ7_08135 [Treponema sp.]